MENAHSHWIGPGRRGTEEDSSLQNEGGGRKKKKNLAGYGVGERSCAGSWNYEGVVDKGRNIRGTLGE